jgi:hypothetical protein
MVSGFIGLQWLGGKIFGAEAQYQVKAGNGCNRVFVLCKGLCVREARVRSPGHHESRRRGRNRPQGFVSQ